MKDPAKLIEEHVLLRSKDYLGIRDFALYDGGGAPIMAWTSPTLEFQSVLLRDVPFSSTFSVLTPLE